MKLRIAKKIICFRGSRGRRVGTFLRARERWTQWMCRMINKAVRTEPLLNIFRDGLDSMRTRR